MTQHHRIFILALFLILVTVLTTTRSFSSETVSAQAGVCTQLVEKALTAVGNNCGGMDRNSTCYGYDQVSASFNTEVSEDFFTRPADRAALETVRTLQTAPYDEALSRWGVALMNVQANVPNTLPGQAVTFILLGDTQVENAVDTAFIPSNPVDITVVPDQNARIRSGSNINSNVLGAVPAGAVLKADGISPDGLWVRVGFENRVGWILAELIADRSLLEGLPQATDQSRTPMQAFYFTSGIGNVECADAPDVVFVQGPKGVQVNLNVNGADILIGSTVALQSQKGDYNSFAADPELAQTYSTTLTGKNLPADAVCEHTSMVMLEGQAILNDFVSLLPIGFAIDSISCRDSSGNLLLATPWRGLRRLSQEELQKFAVIEKMPANILNYPVTIPSDEEIDRAAADAFGDDPIRTEESTPTETVTPTPTGSRGNVTADTGIHPGSCTLNTTGWFTNHP
jgi:hypothetical protein